MVIIITSTANLIASSGVNASTSAVQTGAAATLSHLVTIGGAGMFNKVTQFDPVRTVDEPIRKSDGINQTEKIQADDFVESTATTTFLVFEPDFSRSQTILGIIGSSGTLEPFYDRSPFFYTPSEVDPRLMRDFSEAHQFLMFMETKIESFDPFNRLPTRASIFGVKAGDLKTKGIAHILNTFPVSGTTSESENINQTDDFPPFFDEEDPAPNSTFNAPTDRVVSFHIKDNGSSINQGSVSVFISGVQVITGGTVASSATWPTGSKTVLSPQDIRYSFTRSSDFANQALVVVSGTFADLASPSQGTTEVYTFQMLGSGTLPASITGLIDADAPSIIPLEPENSDTQISPNTQILWRLTDNAAGVDPSKTKFFLNGELVLVNDVALEGSFSRVVNTSRGFDYTYTPAESFSFNQTITGTVHAVDFAVVPNTGTLTYSFTTTPDDTLDIINFFLDAGESILLTSGTIGSVEIVDFTYGVASGTTTITINGETPPGLTTTYSGSGPNRILFTWPWDVLVDFTEDLLVEVHAENKFPGPYPVIREEQFLIRSGYDVFWPNLLGGGPEETFPYLTNVFVNTEVKNFAKNFNTASEFYRFFTEEQAKKDLGAFIEANIKVADLGAFINVLNPYYEYGKTMTLELEVDDLQGNQLRFIHVFTIEDRPT